MDIKKKEHLYYLLAERNSNIRQEYETYKRLNPDEHRMHPKRSLWKLFRLNVHYRIFRKKRPLYYTTVKNNERLPYLEGSESRSFKRQNCITFTKDLLNYDVISFDIFDTLILRPFAKPTDLFILLGSALNIPDFYYIRINSEKEARIKNMKKKEPMKLIYMIYTILLKEKLEFQSNMVLKKN